MNSIDSTPSTLVNAVYTWTTGLAKYIITGKWS
jgi:hypothetical protein